MSSQVYPHLEMRSVILATHIEDPAAYPLLPSALEDHLFVGDLIYEYLARETYGAFDPHYPDGPVDPPLTSHVDSGCAPPPIIPSDPPFPPTSTSPPPPRESPSPLCSGQPPPEPRCRQGTPSFNRVQRKWSCSVCTDAFRDKYECERHIENVGKRMMCLACGKVVCGRRDSRKRHYTKYCKRMDLGQDGDLRFEDGFIEVHAHGLST